MFLEIFSKTLHSSCVLWPYFLQLFKSEWANLALKSIRFIRMQIYPYSTKNIPHSLASKMIIIEKFIKGIFFLCVKSKCGIGIRISTSIFHHHRTHHLHLKNPKPPPSHRKSAKNIVMPTLVAKIIIFMYIILYDLTKKFVNGMKPRIC